MVRRHKRPPQSKQGRIPLCVKHGGHFYSSATHQRWAFGSRRAAPRTSKEGLEAQRLRLERLEQRLELRAEGRVITQEHADAGSRTRACAYSALSRVRFAASRKALEPLAGAAVAPSGAALACGFNACASAARCLLASSSAADAMPRPAASCASAAVRAGCFSMCSKPGLASPGRPGPAAPAINAARMQ